jgi:acetolactate synthase-1/2/3 large subunit
LEASKRPVLAVGCGDLSDHASQAVAQLANKMGIPVLTTYRAKGMVPEGVGWSAGAFGLSPVVDAAQQELLARSDLLLAVGLDPVELRSNWLPGWPETLPMISIDPFGQPDIQHPTLVDLNGAIPDVLGSLATANGASEWKLSEVADHRKKLDDIFEDGPRGPASAVRAVQRACPDNVLLSLDVGAHRITASHVWKASAPRSVIQSNGFSSMGTGLPGAIAARFAFPKRPVVALTGDMGLWMAMGELGVCQDHDLDMVVVVFNDRSLSLIDLKQERGGYPREFVSFSNPNVPTLARAFGGTGVRVQGQGQLGIAVRQAVSSGGLWLIEVDIDPIHYRQQM